MSKPLTVINKVPSACAYEVSPSAVVTSIFESLTSDNSVISLTTVTVAPLS